MHSFYYTIILVIITLLEQDYGMGIITGQEKSGGNKFADLEKSRSKTEALRNRLIGEWAAGLMGKAGGAMEDYVKEVLKADLEEPGDHDVLRKLIQDLKAAGASVTEADVRAQLDQCYREARKQIKQSA